jgi:hypothetical protein
MFAPISTNSPGTYTPSGSPPPPRAFYSPTPLHASPPAATAGGATRAKVELEILSTEASYLSNLQHFITEFVQPLRARAAMALKRKEESWGVDAEALGRIAGNIESIAEFHVLFFRELKAEYDQAQTASQSGTTASPDFARLFLLYADWFKLYTVYLEGYEGCIRTFDSLKDEAKFQKFCREEFVKKPRRSSALMTGNQTPAAMGSVRGSGVAVMLALGNGGGGGSNSSAPMGSVRGSGVASLLSPQFQAMQVGASNGTASATQPQLGPMDYIIQPSVARARTFEQHQGADRS